MGSRGLMGQWGGVQTKGRTGEEKPLGKRAAGPSRPADTGRSVCLAAARTVTNRPTIVPWSQPFVPVTPPPGVWEPRKAPSAAAPLALETCSLNAHPFG